jgi:[acyl-carrier-protein] S-malonyltransferase
VLAILAPGQGAQQQGFLDDWLALEPVRERLDQASDVIGIDLVKAGTTMSDTDITDTALAQPLIVAAGLATAAVLPRLGDPTVFVGHSVGELTAAALAGALTPEDALELVTIRGTAMAAASARTAGGMTAVLGGDAAEVRAAIAAAGCVVANHNATGQVVAAGTLDALDRLAATPPARARLRPLAVAGAFHSNLMSPARDALAHAAGRTRPSHPHHALLSNADGTLVTNGAEALGRLVAQVCAPVRWDLCLRTLATMGVTATIELAPAGTLTALVKRELPEVSALALRSPDDLPAAIALCVEHAAELVEPAPPWQVVVAPARGTATVGPGDADCAVAAGEIVGQVRTRTEAIDVRTEQAGHIVEWLVHDGDPVSEGQPLARIATEVHA